MESLTALVVIVVLAITPSVLFHLFWRFLVSLRDDALIEELRLEHDLDPTRGSGVSLVPLVPRVGNSSASPPTFVTCSNCHAETIADRDACLACGSRLGD